MPVVRSTESQFEDVRRHLVGSKDERFAFLLCDTTTSTGAPVFIVKETLLIPDREVSLTETGWEVSDSVFDDVLNRSVRGRFAVVEAHYHGGSKPRFSRTDRRGLGPMARFALERLGGRPYGATVWGVDSVYGEVFLLDDDGKLTTDTLRSFTVIGEHLRQLISHDADSVVESTQDRQTAWFGPLGQRELTVVKVAIVGLGGTGSHVATQLAHLGVRDFVLVDGDIIEKTNLNRTVTATPDDVGTNKAVVAAKRIRDIATNAMVSVVTGSVLSDEAVDALIGVDVIFGCVDNDGARLMLNRTSLAYRIPYLDVATDISVDGEWRISAVGGRTSVVLANGPCLACMGELDTNEARYFLSTPDEQAASRRAGYAADHLGTSPSVVFLNGLAASALITEFSVLISTVRAIQLCSDIDVLGTGRSVPGTWLTPRRTVALSDCIECAYLDTVDSSDVRTAFRGLMPAPLLEQDRESARRDTESSHSRRKSRRERRDP